MAGVRASHAIVVKAEKAQIPHACMRQAGALVYARVCESISLANVSNEATLYRSTATTISMSVTPTFGASDAANWLA